MASRSQITKLTARIEALADANGSQDATTSLIYIAPGMNKQRVLARHRERWPANPHARGPTLVVWVSVGAAGSNDPLDDPAGVLSPYNDDITWREMAREDMQLCRAR